MACYVRGSRGRPQKFLELFNLSKLKGTLGLDIRRVACNLHTARAAGDGIRGRIITLTVLMAVFRLPASYAKRPPTDADNLMGFASPARAQARLFALVVTHLKRVGPRGKADPGRQLG